MLAFHGLYAFGTMGGELLQSFQVYNPDSGGEVEKRFRGLVGNGIASRFKYIGSEAGKRQTQLMKFQFI